MNLYGGFRFVMGVPPNHHPLILLGFSITNHPAIKGYLHDPPWLWNPPYKFIGRSEGTQQNLPSCGLHRHLWIDSRPAQARGLRKAIVCSKDHQAKRQEMERNGNDWKQPLNALSWWNISIKQFASGIDYAIGPWVLSMRAAPWHL